MHFDEHSASGWENDFEHVAVDWNSPDKILMASEPQDDDAAEGMRELLSHNPEALEAIVAAVLFCIPSRGQTLTPKAALIGFRRFATLASFICPELGGQTFAELAKALGCGRAMLSLNHTKLSDALGGCRVTEKTAKAREAYRQRARRVWADRSKS